MTLSINICLNDYDVKTNAAVLDKPEYLSPASDNGGNITLTGWEFRVEPHSSLQVSRTDTPIIPESRRRFYIGNAGKAKEVKAVFYWSHSFTSEWFEYSTTVVTRGTDAIIMPPSNSLYYSKIVVFNDTDDVAFITAYHL
ncbi:hypothetical protein JZM24_17855 [Candidatus Sodalis endolongispinus]|uniref:JHE-like toxin PirA n=1 Tax=Candidatus Sodalis endolongispinus TaxID=2812662 RepID=A0ABS5YEV1_9GAMM|nr:hypothetical protein [Candidatus Sodalis endolongispinus]MBT9433492.1 hypothetical protein [Candidatus Sodalis endolongispinus]